MITYRTARELKSSRASDFCILEDFTMHFLLVLFRLRLLATCRQPLVLVWLLIFWLPFLISIFLEERFIY